VSTISPFREEVAAAQTFETVPVERAETVQPILSLFPGLPAAVVDALTNGLTSVGLTLAVAAGIREVDRLTDLVFYFRHPERIGRPIRRDERDLVREWLDIRDRTVKPALQPAPAPFRHPQTPPDALSADRLVWPGHSEGELAFMRAVYLQERALAKGDFVMDLPKSELDEIEGQWARKDAAAAARQLLAEARAAAAAERPGVRLGIVSAYRPATRQFEIWQGRDPHGSDRGRGFPHYYAEAKRNGIVANGDFGPAAVLRMAEYMHGFIASPGYSNHQDGLAFDFGTGDDGPKGLGLLRYGSWFHDWLQKNGRRLHFKPLSTEAWHWTYHPPTGASELEVASPAIVARRISVPHVPLLAGHRGRAPDLILHWNDMAGAPAEIDVAVHLHGFWYPHLDLHRDIEPVSGLDLVPIAGANGTGRTRPTLTVLPRGNDTGVKQTQGSYNVYTFPALVTPHGLDDLVQFALERFAHEVRVDVPRIARLILTAHSGGGRPLEQILETHDPHQVHVFDALYWPGDSIVRWARRRVQQDRAALDGGANAVEYMPARGGALRVFYQARYRRGTRPNSIAVRDRLAAELTPELARWYRVEGSTYDHFQIPHRYGWRLLADASADVPDAAAEPVGAHEAEVAFEAEHRVDVVDGFLGDRTSLFRVKLTGTRIHVTWPDEAPWQYTNRALSEAALLAALRAIYDSKLDAAKVHAAWRRLVGHGIKFIHPRGVETRLIVIGDQELIKLAAACGYRPQQMIESWRRQRGLSKMLEYALASAARSWKTLSPYFAASELSAAGMSSELIRHLLARWFESMVEVAKTHSAAKPWRDAFERNADLVEGKREPTLADFDPNFNKATVAEWAHTILQLAKTTRETLNEQLARERADERKRQRNEQLRPHEIPVNDPVAFIVKTYDPVHSVRLDEYGWSGPVQGGELLMNAKGEQIFLLRAESTGIVFQNLVDRKFYKQTLEGFAQELIYAVYAEAGRQSLPAAAIAIGMTRGLFEVVGMIFKPVKHALSAVDVINAGFQLKKNEREIERAYQNVKVAYANIDRLLPATLPKVWRAVLDEKYVHVFNPLEHPDPLPWLKVVVEIAIEHELHAGAGEAVESFLHTAWDAIKKGLGALLESAREQTFELAKKRLEDLHVTGADAIVSQLHRLSNADRERLAREIGELGDHAAKLMEIVKTSLSW
jgi:hypothetical protein